MFAPMTMAAQFPLGMGALADDHGRRWGVIAIATGIVVGCMALQARSPARDYPSWLRRLLAGPASPQNSVAIRGAVALYGRFGFVG
jgi:hypothetical protein